jgi:hypothetical protein
MNEFAASLVQYGFESALGALKLESGYRVDVESSMQVGVMMCTNISEADLFKNTMRNISRTK